MASKEDIEEQLRKAKDWQSGGNAPLVSEEDTLETLLDEFPESDRRYKKLENLQREFPRFRRMKGDGSCGFRALLYGFLYNLSFMGDAARFVELKARLKAASAMLEARGWSDFIYEDWLERTQELCEEMNKRDPETGRQILQETFNDEGTPTEEGRSVSVLQYFRVSTEAGRNRTTCAEFMAMTGSHEQLHGRSRGGICASCRRGLDSRAMV